jgi:hypothetical protein
MSPAVAALDAAVIATRIQLTSPSAEVASIGMKGAPRAPLAGYSRS